MSGLQSRRKLLACLWDLFTLNFPSNLYPVLLILPPSEEETQLRHGIGAMTDELIWVSDVAVRGTPTEGLSRRHQLSDVGRKEYP